MNEIKKLIQKEEYIALAINKYIYNTGIIPKKVDSLDWNLLLVDEYLGSNFNKKNPLTNDDIIVKFDINNKFYVLSINEKEYINNHKFLYDFYINKIFRINTMPPINTKKENIIKGTEIVYSSLQKEIVSLLSKSEIVLPLYKSCIVGKYFYEINRNKLIYKYCKDFHNKIKVYQKSPIYVQEMNDLKYIKSEIGASAFSLKNNKSYEFYYQGDVENAAWIPYSAEIASIASDNLDNIKNSYSLHIPKAKTLIFRKDGGCFLVLGDIYCWGKNIYQKVGIENSEEEFINTPVMLKVQKKNDEGFNSPFRVKFEDIAINNLNTCAISTIFKSNINDNQIKMGGDLYCNGKVSSNAFEEVDILKNQTAILKRNKFFAKNKTNHSVQNQIYLIKVAMIKDTIAVLSNKGEVYTLGKNYKGALGIGSDDKFLELIDTSKMIALSNIRFEELFALRNEECFGAIDSDGRFWIWGEINGRIYNKPIKISDKKFNKNFIFENSNNFILKAEDGKFYKTFGNKIKELSQIKEDSLKISLYEEKGKEFYLYINDKNQLEGSTELLSCDNCTNEEKEIFKNVFVQLGDIKNISIYKVENTLIEKYDDFELNAEGWVAKLNSKSIPVEELQRQNPPISTGTKEDIFDKNRINPTKFLGRFKIGTEEVEKVYSFGSLYAGHEVEIEFDFYEIDSWDFEKFNVYLNDINYVDDGFIHDNHAFFKDTNDTGKLLQNIGTSYNAYWCRDIDKCEKYNDEKYHYKFKTKLDMKGNLKVKFKTRFLQDNEDGANRWSKEEQNLNDESWGIDNVRISLKEKSKKLICVSTEKNTFYKTYCWGEAGRMIPILSTSLYDMDKINSLNKLVISSKNDKDKQMTYDDYINKMNNNLLLKYPTYLGGFDYLFNFK